MTKKILSVLLAVVIAVSAFTVAVYADGFDANTAYGIGASDYLAVPDADFTTIKTMLDGNPAMSEDGVATIIKPGETLGILSKDKLTVTYYPDADSATYSDTESAGRIGWTATNKNVEAFSASGQSLFRDNISATVFKGNDFVYTVLDIGEATSTGTIDYTINHDGVTAEAKESGEVFLGWAVYSYTAASKSSASVVLYGVWAKNPDYEGSSSVEDPGDPLEYILDYYIGFIASIFSQIAEFIRSQMNRILDHINSLVAGL